jgi:hypothetical protein
LKRCVEDRGLLRRLRRGVRPPRSMADVADEMMSVYDSVINHERRDVTPAHGFASAATC